MNRGFSFGLAFTVAAAGLLNSGCGALPRGTAAGGSEPVRSEVAFSPKGMMSGQEALRALAEVRIEIERRGKTGQNAQSAALKLDKYIDGSPEVAQFLIDEKIIERVPNADGVGNFHRHLKARSLQTLIASGQLERLASYWDGVYSQPWGQVYWFSVDFAIAVSRYVALSDPRGLRGATAQRSLAQYWRTGCETSFYAGNKPDAGILGLLLKDTCSPRSDLVVAYYFMYATNPSRDVGQKIALARELGDQYFSEKKYAEAAGWYHVIVGLAKEGDKAVLSWSAFEAFSRLYKPGMSIGEAIEYANSLVQSKLQGDIATSVRRLQMIKDLGIPAIAALPGPTPQAL